MSEALKKQIAQSLSLLLV